MPYWDKALVYQNSKPNTGQGITNESEEEEEKVVYIPFVRDSQKLVNASIIIKMSETDTAYKVISSWQYSEFGFDTTNTTSWSARDIFNIFSKLDYEVFGYTKYRVKDGRIFGHPQETQLEVTHYPNTPEQITTEEFLLLCNTSSTVCITAEPFLNRVTTETVCGSTTICSLIWVDPPGGGGGSSGGGGSGGGGGTGGSGGGPQLPPDNPCPTLERIMTEVTNPCDTIAWVPEPQPNENINGEDDICRSSFRFYQVIAPTNGVGGWRVAGTTNIHMKLFNTGQVNM